MSPITPDTLRADKDFIDRLTALRQDIHRHPETAFEEHRTSQIVADRLTELGIEIHRGLGGTGVVGTLKGKRPGQRVIALRADMDALFIEEQTGLPYSSEVPGKMHACGHDGHTAMLLGAAEKLASNPDFAGTVNFIFQPAEEGLGGARVMIEDGLFDLFPCDAIYGIHNGPKEPLGRVQTRPGAFMAAGDTWEVIFEGTGGHGAMPHAATDPTVPAGQFIASLSQIISRKVPSTDPAVISVGHIDGGDYNSPNIIPASVVVRGTARSYRAEVRDILENTIGAFATSCAAPHDVSAKLIYTRRYPPLVNTKAEVENAVSAATAIVGEPLVDPKAPLAGGSEDFSFMLEKIPGAYVMIGNGDGPNAAFVHTPAYDFNDALIPFGVAYWVSLVAIELGDRT
ncbi:M20 aminoacylase family protein [Salipiger mucosus]|uniref:Catalyzes the cleavage of p-aminobenzoyl-glutamate to p-aminobenzoate and glutamate, subunit A n=1 Tax=Salipiger mucosus DSM 16094 TaxID=1123237 RepID=S9S0I2_9RHOB|nr:M20 aminoacylase family protein [Salipiger mucosus]EPX83735.1 Catalyzes the cleavage of p-aminobenzoyl-glutamate to p-aminobenzoate and glutamate, subunit A [Salipiger mucosus DSM 16094]